jgi:hypothetical protein
LPIICHFLLQHVFSLVWDLKWSLNKSQSFVKCNHKNYSLGFAEGVSYPSVHHLMARWLPKSERGAYGGKVYFLFCCWRQSNLSFLCSASHSLGVDLMLALYYPMYGQFFKDTSISSHQSDILTFIQVIISHHYQQTSVAQFVFHHRWNWIDVVFSVVCPCWSYTRDSLPQVISFVLWLK